MEIEELFRQIENWPPILEDTWQGDAQSNPALLNLWGQTYARAYGWMLSLGITSKLWQDFGTLSCNTFTQGLVFDAGIGRGDITKRLLDSNPNTKVIGGDWSIPFLQQAQKNFASPSYIKRLALCHMDLARPWPQNWTKSFAGIMCNYVAAYMPFAAQKNILSESHRVLQHGGTLLFNFMDSGVAFRDVIRFNSRDELKRNPLNMLRAILLIPIFTSKVDKARSANLIQSFNTKQFENAAYTCGFREVSIASWHLPLTANSFAVPTYKLVK